ncbi:synaptonemal complex central element protein 2 [Gracilinanus agilis]|uniref:synaptonemal complex central element protein 2 n=1 Tax=Gracilinanus agilis TaxID=191870 RepID=UPI001CFE8D13|nr:synaptonemal complex central element protein 2 [Gracilinanus agilis]
MEAHAQLAAREGGKARGSGLESSTCSTLSLDSSPAASSPGPEERPQPPTPRGAPLAKKLLGTVMSEQDLKNKEQDQHQDQAGPSIFSELERNSSPNDVQGRFSSPSLSVSNADSHTETLDGKTSSFFVALDASIETLQKRAQQLIDSINESRQKDHTLMSNFRDSLKMKVSDLVEKLEERMYQIYDHHNKLIQEKLQEFSEKMEKINNLETELKQVCHTVETVYKDLCVQPEI